MMDALWQDVRYAARSLARQPLVAVVAALSLALGIGVNSALFTVFDNLLLRRLPVSSPEEIVLITSPGPRPGGTSTSAAGRQEAVFSYPLFRDLESLNDVGFSSIAAHRDFEANLAYRGQTQIGEGLLVSGGYFAALRLTPALGRLFTRDDDRIPNGHPIAVLSHAYWSSRFGSHPGVVGDTLAINGVPMTIIGVAPDGFSGTTTMESPQVFVPLSMVEQLSAGPGRASRKDHYLYAFGRLAPGVSLIQAQSRINGPFTTLMRDVEYPLMRSGLATNADRAAFQARQVVLRDGTRARGADRGRMQVLALVLFGVTGFVLLIACANAANLLLARATDRSTELALRLSMGATTSRLVRLLLTEACLLGVTGAIAGLLVAKGTLVWSTTLMPSEDQSLLMFAIDNRVLTFTLALGVVTGIAFGLLPSLYGARTGLAATAHAPAARTSGSRGATRTRTALATVQIALATALLAMAGLFLVSLMNLVRLDLGIKTDGLMTFRISPYRNGYTTEQSRILFEQIGESVRGIPGVVSVGQSTIALLGNDGWTQKVTVERHEAVEASVNASLIGPDYFKTVGMAVLAGREFTRADAGTSAKVAIVNQQFARSFGLDQSVIGTRMALGRGDRKVLDIEIVGFVADAKLTAVREDTPPQVFLPYRQNPVASLTFYVRSNADPRQLSTSIASVVARADRNLPVENLRTMDEQAWNSVTGDRVLATLSSSFAGLATVLAGIGLYAMLAHLVARRVREMGIRIALGARGIDVQRLVFGHVGRMVVVGGSLGAALAFAIERLSRSILYGLDGSEPVIIGVASLIVVSVAIVAGFIPARRASLVNPVDALRAE